MLIKDIKIIDIIQDGRGVGKKDGKTIFIENAIFGEVLDAEILDFKKNYLEARKIQTKIQSKYFRKPPCPYFDECGGCSIMNINYQRQIELKKNLIKNALKKSAKIENSDLEIMESKEFHYRNKIRLKVDENGNLNYLKNYSYQYVAIKNCLIANELISNNLSEITKISRDINQNSSAKIDEITIRSNKTDILLNMQGKFDQESLNYIKENYLDGKYKINLIDGKKLIVISGNGYLEYNILGKNFKISALDFYQVNDFQIENLYSVAKEFLGENQKILDLYCGSATSSIAINGDNVIGVEINKNAITDANENAKRNGLKNYKFLAKNAKYIDEKFIKNEKIDAITLDPPRAGLDKDLIKAITDSKIQKIVYISCNPQTLARDIKRFTDKAYSLKKIKAVDMFPQTMHVECIALIQRVKSWKSCILSSFTSIMYL